jgi:hypothetical protein
MGTSLTLPREKGASCLGVVGLAGAKPPLFGRAQVYELTPKPVESEGVPRVFCWSNP